MKGTNLELLCNIISDELDKLDVWFSVNKLSLNVAKTNYMVFGNKKSKDSRICINEKQINEVYVTTFLGVQIDNKLTWKDQINKVNTKLSKCIAILYKASSSLNNNSLIKLYNALFLPYLNYCTEIWANTYQTNLKSIVLSQKKAIRIVHRVSKRTHTNDFFYSCKLLKFVDIVKYKTCMLMFKAYNNMLPLGLQKMFTLNKQTDTIVTRQQNKFKIIYSRTSVKAHSLSVAGPKLWNSLPIDIMSCNKISVFKAKIKSFYLQNYKLNF